MPETLSLFLKNIANSPDMNVASAGNEPAYQNTEFWVGPAVGSIYIIRSMIITVTAVAMDYGNTFGGVSGPLVNGVKMETRREGLVVHDFTDGKPFLRNRELLTIAGPSAPVIYDNANPAISDVLRLVVDFQGLTGYPVVLNGRTQDRLVIRVQDNLSTLGMFRARVLGTVGL